MPKQCGSIQLSNLARVTCLVALCMLAIHPVAARPLGTTWFVTTSGDDVTAGDVNTHSGTLRFTLAHAQNGDFVSFANFDRVVDIIDISSGLIVPAGVAVGHTRNEACGSVMSPLVNIRAQGNVTVVVSLGMSATLRNLDIAGGTISVKATGADADICGAGLGFMHDETDGLLPAPPATAALIVDGPRAVLHQSWVNGTIIISPLGSDTRIGDAIGGSGDANQGTCGNQGRCPVSVLADQTSAAQRVTIRDVFPRGLLGLLNRGISGGDDVITHTNNWVQTPVISSALSMDHFASVLVQGQANPLSLVDVYFDDHITLARQIPVTADASGLFTFSAALPAAPIWVYAVSTLNDPTHLNRLGSSSQWSGVQQVAEALSNTATPTPTLVIGMTPTPTPTITSSPSPSATATIAPQPFIWLPIVLSSR